MTAFKKPCLFVTARFQISRKEYIQCFALHFTTYTLFFVQNLYCCPQKWGWIWASSWPVVTVTVAPAPVVYQQLHVSGRVLAIQFISLNCLHVTGCAPTTWLDKQSTVWTLPLEQNFGAPRYFGVVWIFGNAWGHCIASSILCADGKGKNLVAKKKIIWQTIW